MDESCLRDRFSLYTPVPPSLPSKQQALLLSLHCFQEGVLQESLLGCQPTQPLRLLCSCCRSVLLYCPAPHDPPSRCACQFSAILTPVWRSGRDLVRPQFQTHSIHPAPSHGPAVALNVLHLATKHVTIHRYRVCLTRWQHDHVGSTSDSQHCGTVSLSLAEHTCAHTQTMLTHLSNT